VLTPVIKAHLTDGGFEASSIAVQCLGGHGYVREWGLEQLMRDARIGSIYEGTNGVQAMDLVGRKLFAQGGRCIATLFETIDRGCRDDGDVSAMGPLLSQLRPVLADAREVTGMLQQRIPAEPMLAGAVASHYLTLIGLLAMGYIWARVSRLALAHVGDVGTDASFYESKVALASFYFANSLPLAHACVARIRAGAGPVTTLPLEAY